ncbi:MAG: aminoglycoside phosphotransferase family protein [Mycobacteriales bacterium]
MIRHAAREAGRLVADRVLRGSLPRTVDGVDAALLSSLLGREVAVTGRLDGTQGTTDRVRLALTGDGVPASVFVKTASHSAGTRLFGGLASLGENEVRFYRDVRPALQAEAPRAHAVPFDGTTGRFLLVLEDLAARGARFADTLTPLTVDEAAGALDTLRRVHASPPPAWALSNSADPMLSLVTRALGPLSRKVDPALQPSAAAWVLREYRSLARALDQGPLTLLHGDPHPGNLYLVDGRVGLLDWQVVRRGNRMRDVTYLLVLGLTPEDRAAHERALLAHYTSDDVWAEYRRFVAYVYVATTFTCGLGGLQGASIADEGLRRAVRALDELETLSALSALTCQGAPTAARTDLPRARPGAAGRPRRSP